MNDTNNTKPSFFKRLFIFGSTPKVLLNFLGMILATFLAMWLTFGLLKCYTQHNRTFEVPDFVKMNIEDIKAMADDSRFDFDFSKSAYNRRVPMGIIIHQDPMPGARAKNGRTIYLTYNPMEADKHVIPDLLYGLRYEYAKSNLEAAEFECRVIKKVIDPDAPGTVQEVSYKGQTVVSKKQKYKEIVATVGDTIDLVVSEDYNGGSTQVPDLICLTYAEALFKLRNGHNLMLGTVVVDATVTDSSTAYVVSQYPYYAPGEFIHIGSQVDLRLSQKKPTDCGNAGFDDDNNGGGNDFIDDDDDGTGF